MGAIKNCWRSLLIEDINGWWVVKAERIGAVQDAKGRVKELTGRYPDRW